MLISIKGCARIHTDEDRQRAQLILCGVATAYINRGAVRAMCTLADPTQFDHGPVIRMDDLPVRSPSPLSPGLCWGDTYLHSNKKTFLG